MSTSFATYLLLLTAGPGTELLVDDGYFGKPVEFGGKWTPLVKTVRVIGTYEGLLVCVDKRDHGLPYDGFMLLTRTDHRLRAVLRIGRGRLEHVVPNVGVRHEPP